MVPNPVQNLLHPLAGVDLGTLNWDISEKSESETEDEIKENKSAVVRGIEAIQREEAQAGMT